MGYYTVNIGRQVTPLRRNMLQSHSWRWRWRR